MDKIHTAADLIILRYYLSVVYSVRHVPVTPRGSYTLFCLYWRPASFRLLHPPSCSWAPMQRFESICSSLTMVSLSTTSILHSKSNLDTHESYYFPEGRRFWIIPKSTGQARPRVGIASLDHLPMTMRQRLRRWPPGVVKSR